MRIIAGDLRGILVPNIKKANYRPTTSKVKESLFSILGTKIKLPNKLSINYEFTEILEETVNLSLDINDDMKKKSTAQSECVVNFHKKSIQDYSTKNFLDICSGTGSIGLEALSRGFSFVTFIDINHETLESINIFAKKHGLTERISTFNKDIRFLKQPYNRKYDIIFIDPPYFSGNITTLMDSLDKFDWMNPGALVIIETAKKEDLDCKNLNYNKIDERIYGNSKLSFFEWKSYNDV
jgi:16S rRNA (guanine966-N2)-methyltransferase